jgi:Double zinc ribbon
MRCSNCGVENPERLKFCNQCAAPFSRRCASCGFENIPSAKFCGACAAPLASSASQARAPRLLTPAFGTSHTAAEGERKTVTALFADIKSSVELMENLETQSGRVTGEVCPSIKWRSP